MYDNPMWGISILADFRPMGYKLLCCQLGKNLSFKSVLGHCGLGRMLAAESLEFIHHAFVDRGLNY